MALTVWLLKKGRCVSKGVILHVAAAKGSVPLVGTIANSMELEVIPLPNWLGAFIALLLQNGPII